MEFAVQARLIERRGDVVVRDDTRLDAAAVLGDAVAVARALAAEGFTVWIYEVRRAHSGPPTYVTVDTFGPDPRPPAGASGRRPVPARRSGTGLRRSVGAGPEALS